MPSDHSAIGDARSDSPGDREVSAGVETRPERDAAMSRRQFVSAAGLAALGLAAGCTPLGGSSTTPRSRTGSSEATTSTAGGSVQAAGFGPLWKPIAGLSTVAVAANAAASGYPALTNAEAFGRHPAIALLETALTGVSGATPVEYLRTLVPMGGTVLIKPNWVEAAKWNMGKITHPSLVIAAARLAAEAVGPSGRVLIAEGTSEGPELPVVLAATGFRRALETLAPHTAERAPISIVDLNAASTKRLKVALDTLSRYASRTDVMFDPHNKSMGKMGDNRVGTYLVSRPIVDADLIIDMAKAKVHCSAGVTLALKNFVGIVPSDDGPYKDNSLKDIPHYSQVDRDSGSQYVANRTIGFTSADLQAAAAYVARDGSLQRKAQRKLLCIIDGVVSGQKSQFTPDPVKTGFIVVGTDPVAVDHVGARCMGFDPTLVKSFQAATTGTLALGTGSPSGVRVVYKGPGAFSEYFSARKQLEPESGIAQWGDTMKLRVFNPAASHVSVNGDRLVVAASTGVPVVRLESGGYFADLTKSAAGAFEIAWPPANMQQARLVLMDKHFNLAEKTVTA